MLRNFIPGKLTRFAVLMLFVFLLAQSGAARAQGDDPQLFSTILAESINSGGWGNCRDTGNSLLGPLVPGASMECISSSIPVSWDGKSNTDGFMCSAPGIDTLPDTIDKKVSIFIRRYSSPEEGQAFIQDCDPDYACESFSFHDYPTKVNSGMGQYRAMNWMVGDIRFTVNVYYSCDISTLPGLDPLPEAEIVYNAAVNQGVGVSQPPEPNPNPEPNPDPYIEPDPYVDPNPNPNPDPGLIGIDQETLEMLQSILSAPGLPITGAVAGGLVAWVISMLGGGRSVMPPPPRPPTGGVRPGQVGPDGKIWSPGQGWVSKSTYDYQQKWLQKGWRLNPQTNKLEVQPGAVSESGKVWYKLPYDEGNSNCWVDKARVDECERNMAEGLVYDHSLGGWVKSNDLADFNRSKQGFYDNVSSPEARQRDHERLMQQEVAPDSQYQKIANDIKQMEDKLNKWQSDSIKGDMEHEQDKIQRQMERAETMDRWSNRVGMVETGADVFISVAAKFTGPVGKSVEWWYNTVKRTALSVDTGIAQKSIKAGVLDYGESYVKDKVVDKVSSVLSVDTVSSVPGKVFKKFVAGTDKPGIKELSKPLLKGVKGVGAVVDYGKGKLVEDGYDELGEYLGQVIQPGSGS